MRNFIAAVLLIASFPIWVGIFSTIVTGLLSLLAYNPLMFLIVAAVSFFALMAMVNK
jgi:hypothetical protein